MTDQFQSFLQAVAPTVPWQVAYKAVEEKVRVFLSTVPVTEYLTTSDLVEELFPEELARGDLIYHRRRVFKALAALATRGLSDCTTRGDPKHLGNTKQMVRPWHWHQSIPGRTPPAAVCQTCGKPL